MDPNIHWNIHIARTMIAKLGSGKAVMLENITKRQSADKEVKEMKRTRKEKGGSAIGPIDEMFRRLTFKRILCCLHSLPRVHLQVPRMSNKV